MVNVIKVFVCIITVLLLQGCTQTKWITKDLTTLKPGIDSVTIVFPHVGYSEKHGELFKPKLGYSVFVSRKVADVLKEIIDQGGFISKAAIFVCDSMVIDEWLPTYYAASMTRYQNLKDSLLKVQDQKVVFPIIPELQMLVDRATTKYFIFIQGTAFGSSIETKRYDILQEQVFKLLYGRPFAYDYQWSGLRLHIYIVDKESRELVWYNYNDSGDTKYNPLKEEEIRALCKKLLESNVE